MITLRNFAEADALDLQRNKYRHKTISEVQDMIREMNRKCYNDKYFEMFAVVHKGSIVGMISLYEHSKWVVSCGPEIFASECRKGYGYEALLRTLLIAREKGYKIAVAQIRTDNIASIALHEKARFEMEHEYVNSKGNAVYFMMRPTEFSCEEHYDMLVDEGNDPVCDSDLLQKHMNKWDGNEFIDELQIGKDKRVLEIGVGTGRLAKRVAPLCKVFTGVDISSKTIKRAKENLRELENIELYCADFIKYEFDCSFDVIYSSLTFMHIKNKQEAINKIATLLNDNGRFVLSIDKNKNEYIDYGTRIVEIYPDDLSITKKYIKKSGLQLEKVIETELAYIIVATNRY
ncbi:MAG: GNAT family N-acetyltransferase [Tyzzerella sp.]|nr:GNAT family N-acetyltransferase [Tyzzerella sp.]